MSGLRIILRLADGSDGILALRAARGLIDSGHTTCVYSFTNGVDVYAHRNKTGVTAREIVGGRAL